MKKNPRGKAKNTLNSPRQDLFAKVSEEEVMQRFNRLIEAMAKAPALPKKKKRTVVRQTPDDVFDD
jgi:hypothetical protein